MNPVNVSPHLNNDQCIDIPVFSIHPPTRETSSLLPLDHFEANHSKFIIHCMYLFDKLFDIFLLFFFFLSQQD